MPNNWHFECHRFIYEIDPRSKLFDSYPWSCGLLEVERIKKIKTSHSLRRLATIQQKLLNHSQSTIGKFPKLSEQFSPGEDLKTKNVRPKY